MFNERSERVSEPIEMQMSISTYMV